MRRHHRTAFALLAVGLVTLRVGGEENANMSDSPGTPTEWTKPDMDRGYVVFSYTTQTNLAPSHVPAPRDVAARASCALARDEYESIQLGVHALADGIQAIGVTVESDLDVTVYHRISPSVKEQLAAAPPEEDEILSWVPSEIHLQRGNVFEALPAGQSVNFWLTFHADEKAKAGLHQGRIRIRPEGRPETVVDLEVRVRPFALQRPRIPFGVYFREDMLPRRFGGREAPRESVLAMYRDMAEHGHNSGWFYPMGSFAELPPTASHALGKLMPLAQQAGLLDPDVPSLICGGIPGSYDEEHLRAAADWLEAERRERGWPELVVFGTDEPAYPRDYDQVRTELMRLRGLPLRVNLDLSGISAYGYAGNLCDIQTVMDGMVTPELLAEASRAGIRIWTYSFRIWREDYHLFRQRYFAGLYTWVHRLEGNWIWAYHHGRHRHAWFAPDSHQPMPVTAWEARREGIDDYRYLQMVEDCVAANPEEMLAIEAAAWLQSLRTRIAASIPNEVQAGEPLALDEYDGIRARAADYIERLGPVGNEAAAGPPAAPGRDEAAPYRGRSVEQCLAGLARPDVSERRAAAWALFELGPAAAPATAALTRALDDPEVRMPALHALEYIGPDAFPAAPRLAGLLAHPDWYVRLGALLALGEIGCPLDKRERGGRRTPSDYASVVAAPLNTALQDEHRSLSYLAAHILSAMGDRSGLSLPDVMGMLDGASPKRSSAALGLITDLGPDAAAAVPRLIELHGEGPWDRGHVNALAAIGPAASAAIPVLEKYAAAADSGPDRAHAHYALCLIRGEVPDLRNLVDLLRDERADTDTEREVVSLLNQLGARAAPLADEIRQLLESGALPDAAAGLQEFVGKVQQGVEPRISYDW